MKVWMNSLLTEEDDKTPNVAAILWIVGAVFFVVFAGIAVWKSGTFDAQSYGIGFGSVLGGGGAGLALKQKSGA